MKAMRYWLKAILIDAAVFGTLWYHMDTGSEGAARAFQVFAWFFTLLLLFFGLFGDKSQLSGIQRPKGMKTYHYITEILLVWLTAWAGMWVLAAFRLLATLLAEAARDREPKVKEPA
ncbi:hypothetical protein [Cupriavidus pauculus]|uniref:Uncharacterized protein n=1 Tax=Cupriavidus pauculus TaxID=82633 RepID=A0A2N5C404_9BURK|nr:hypothetical protein [Cupriavidus pauculus]PLP96942.1 hypothetical protein CYJ10_29300 [Cupriavidus pauculus]